MPVVDVDFATYKAIVALRLDETMSEGDVVREAIFAFRLNGNDAVPAGNDASADEQIWWHKGLSLPVGLDLEHGFRDGRVARAKVVMGGIEYEGRRFGSLSAAGVEAAGHQVDGWAFWNFRNDRGEWLPMKAKRRTA